MAQRCHRDATHYGSEPDWHARRIGVLHRMASASPWRYVSNIDPAGSSQSIAEQDRRAYVQSASSSLDGRRYAFTQRRLCSVSDCAHDVAWIRISAGLEAWLWRCTHTGRRHTEGTCEAPKRTWQDGWRFVLCSVARGGARHFGRYSLEANPDLMRVKQTHVFLERNTCNDHARRCSGSGTPHRARLQERCRARSRISARLLCTARARGCGRAAPLPNSMATNQYSRTVCASTCAPRVVTRRRGRRTCFGRASSHAPCELASPRAPVAPAPLPRRRSEQR